MSDPVTNLASRGDARVGAAIIAQQAKIPLSDLFANVLNKSNFAEQMLVPSEMALTRAAERSREVRDDTYHADSARAESEPADEAAAEVNGRDDRSDDNGDAAPDKRAGDEQHEDGAPDTQPAAPAAAADGLMTALAARNGTNKPGLTVQPNAASGVTLHAKTDGTTPDQARVATTGAAGKAAHTANALAQGAAAQANFELGKQQAGANGQRRETNGASAASERPLAVRSSVLAPAQTAADGTAGGLANLSEQHIMLIRAGAKRAAELHNMKVRLEAHRDELQKATAQSGTGAQSPTSTAGAHKPAIEITSNILPAAPAAPDGPPLRSLALFGSPTFGALPGRAGPTSSALTAIGDTPGNGVETASALADRHAALSQTARGHAPRPAASQLPYQPAEQIKVHIQQLVKSGTERIQVRLSPASLGRVEVALEVAPDKVVHAIVYADKPETLDMLERDARVLREAFEQAGMKFDSDGLTFRHGHSGNADAKLADGAAAPEGGVAADGDETAGTDEAPRRRQHDGMLDLEI